MYTLSMTTRIGTRGQVVIPIEYRERLGLLPDTEVIFVEQHGQLMITPAPKLSQSDNWHKVRGTIKRRRINVDADIEEMRGR